MQQWDLRSMELRAHHPEVLQSEQEGRTIALLLPAGERLQSHQVHERTWLVVVDGEVEIEQGDESVEAGSGSLLVFGPSEAHEVSARSDARLLLLLAPWPGEGHPSRQAS